MNEVTYKWKVARIMKKVIKQKEKLEQIEDVSKGVRIIRQFINACEDVIKLNNKFMMALDDSEQAHEMRKNLIEMNKKVQETINYAENYIFLQ